CELRISRVARVELCADRVRHGVLEGALSRGVLSRDIERVADGILFAGHADSRCEAAEARGARSVPARRKLGVHDGAVGGRGEAGAAHRLAFRARHGRADAGEAAARTRYDAV